jgi:fucose permease
MEGWGWHVKVQTWRAALCVTFAITGVGAASWASRTPGIKEGLGVSIAGMGLILFGASVGAMVGVLMSASLVKRHGGRFVIAAGTSVVIAGLAIVAISAALAWAPGVFLGLMCFGLGSGSAEVALNVEGAKIEAITGKPALPLMHGCFSLGTVIGASAGIIANNLEIPVLWHLLVIVALCGTAGAVMWRFIPPGSGRSDERGNLGADLRAWFAVWADYRLILIAFIVLAMAFAEGTANDWLPLLLVETHASSAALGAAVYAVFTVAMTVGRFFGGPLVERFGRPSTLGVSALSAAVGLAVVIVTPNLASWIFGAVVWGLGASLGFPVGISASAEGGGDSTTRVSATATGGYVAFLVGPPLLGFLGNRFGLGTALWVVVGLALAAVAASVALSRYHRDGSSLR